jgi:hypothetical protein
MTVFFRAFATLIAHKRHAQVPARPTGTQAFSGRPSTPGGATRTSQIRPQAGQAHLASESPAGTSAGGIHV